MEARESRHGDLAGRPIGVGIVGLSASAGWAARAHVPAIEAVDGMELRALTASSPASAQAASEAFGIPAAGSTAELAARDDVDLVVVAVKVPHHRELVLAALEAGKPVLCEWPLAVDLAEAEALERAARGTGGAAGVRSFVGLQGRTTPTFRWLADLVAGGHVGAVLSATMVGSSGGWGDPVSERGRYLLDKRNGATMLSIAFGHAMDAVSLVVGELDHVSATTATRRPLVPDAATGELIPMTAEDQVAISGTVPGGAVVSAHHRGGVAPGFSLVIDGTEGRLEATASTHPHTTHVTVYGGHGTDPLAELSLPAGYDAYPAHAGTPVSAVAHAYAAIRDDLVNGTTTAPDFAHAVKRHRLLDAIERSAATGRRVAV